MRVLQVIPRLAFGGLEILALTLFRNSKLPQYMMGIQEANVKIADMLDPDEIERFTCINKPEALHLPSILKIRRIVKSLKITAIHTHSVGPLLYGGLAAKMLFGVRHIHTFHDTWSLENKHNVWITKGLERIARPQFVALGTELQQQLHKILPRTHIHVIPNAIDVAQYYPTSKQEARKVFGLPPTVRLIGVAARLRPVKGLQYLLKAMENVYPDCHLALAGAGPEEQNLKAQCKAISERVHFLGLLKQMPEFYNAIDIFCLPSLMEGLPLSILEAQACGIPTIASDVGNMHAGLCPVTSLMVPPANSDALANAINYRLSHPITQSPRDFIEKNFNISSMIEAYDRLYEGED